MDFSKIKGRSFPVLEQACERYAIMAFEALNGCLAIGLQSIQYSYRNDSRKKGCGEFCATFVPWKQVGKPARQEQTLYIEWGIEALPDGEWRLYDGIAVTKNADRVLHSVGWSHDGLCMRFVHDGQVSYGSHGHEEHVLCLNEVRI